MESKYFTIADVVLGLASFGIGVFHGVCDASGTPALKDMTHYILAAAPTAVQSVVNGLAGGIDALADGITNRHATEKIPIEYARKGLFNYGYHVEISLGRPLGKLDKLTIIPAAGAGGAAIGSIYGAAVGAAETALGYGLGRLLAKHIIA